MQSQSLFVCRVSRTRPSNSTDTCIKDEPSSKLQLVGMKGVKENELCAVAESEEKQLRQRILISDGQLKVRFSSYTGSAA